MSSKTAELLEQSQEMQVSPLSRIRSKAWMPVPLLLALVFFTACSSEHRPDMILDVSFEGLGCEDALIDTVDVHFETGDMGSFSTECDSAGVLSLLIPEVPVGTHQLLVQGLDQGFPIYALRVEIDHGREGPHIYGLDLRLATELVAYFTFAGFEDQDGLNCEQAQVDYLNIEVVGLVKFSEVPCSSAGVDGASLLGIVPGSYDVKLSAFDRGGNELYHSAFSDLEIFEGSNEYLFNLEPLLNGGLEFLWSFGARRQGCGEAGVDRVRYWLEGPDGQLLTATSGEEADCEDVGHFWEDLLPGFYTLQKIEGLSAGGATRFKKEDVRLYVAAGNTFSFDVVLDPISPALR